MITARSPIAALTALFAALAAGLLLPPAAADDPPPAADPAAAPPRPLFDLPAAATPIDDWLKAGAWEVDRHSPKHWTVADGALHMVSSGDSVMIHTERGFPYDPGEYPMVHFEVKVDALPAGADNSKSGKDDSAFRLFFSFDTSGTPPKTVGYGWTWNDPLDAVVTSGHFKNVKVVVIAAGADQLGAWLTIDRDLAADYRRCFGDGPVPKVKAVALKCDTNDLAKTRAESWVRAVSARKR